MAILQKTKADVQWEHWTTEDAEECGDILDINMLDIKVMHRECEPLKEMSQVTLNCKYWFAVSHEGNSLQGAPR